MMGTAAALTNLSPEPFEAAKIDGNSRWDVFTRVTLPQIKPVLDLANVPARNRRFQDLRHHLRSDERRPG